MNSGNAEGTDEKTEEELLVADSKTSYFTLDQYSAIKRRIAEAQYRMKEQQTLIETLDGTMSATLSKFRKRTGLSARQASSRIPDGLRH